MTTSPTPDAAQAVAPSPTRMEWHREGYIVWADEDGVHLKTPGGGFEMPEAMALVELYGQVLAQYKAGVPFGKPVPPTPEQRAYHYPGSYTARRVERAVTEAIRNEFSDL